MSYKRFRKQDIVQSTMVAKPDFNFIVHSGNVFYQREKPISGSFSNLIKHIPTGYNSLYELNIDRPSDSLIYAFIEKDSTRYAFRTVTTSQFDSQSTFPFGEQIKMLYPLSASMSRIYIPAGAEFSSSAGAEHANKKYIRALKNPISSANVLGPSNKYGNLGTKAVNMLCVPGIFAGSGIDKGSIELSYYVTGTLVATAKDLYSDGRMIQTYGSTTGTEVGSVIYNQGIVLLTGSDSLHDSSDKFFSPSSNSSPSWLSFGTGLKQVGQELSHGIPDSSSYSISFKGVNKVPTLTMFAFSEKGEHNFSHNPTFLSASEGPDYNHTTRYHSQARKLIKKINKSPYANHEEDFESTTYISKIGIYDKNKNLIAVASLANPVKKTTKRDFMFKLRLDF
ncbi:MAG: hypothetical protein CMC82_00450 [Flavobacteriaceae bacterium]|nr:hypothetical protein [Flavobacteriaceae bacterium]|tara:strand:- start:1128 stop:2309 length:1182 start_codon:yes stop_codon:yes gene_type:complete